MQIIQDEKGYAKLAASDGWEGSRLGRLRAKGLLKHYAGGNAKYDKANNDNESFYMFHGF